MPNSVESATTGQERGERNRIGHTSSENGEFSLTTDPAPSADIGESVCIRCFRRLERIRHYESSSRGGIYSIARLPMTSVGRISCALPQLRKLSWLRLMNADFMGNGSNFGRDLFGREDEVDTAARNGRSGHVGMRGCLGQLRDSDAPDVADATQRVRPIAVVAGDDDGDQLAVPVGG